MCLPYEKVMSLPYEEVIKSDRHKISANFCKLIGLKVTIKRGALWHKHKRKEIDWSISKCIKK